MLRLEDLDYADLELAVSFSHGLTLRRKDKRPKRERKGAVGGTGRGFAEMYPELMGTRG